MNSCCPRRSMREYPPCRWEACAWQTGLPGVFRPDPLIGRAIVDHATHWRVSTDCGCHNSTQSLRLTCWRLLLLHCCPQLRIQLLTEYGIDPVTEQVRENIFLNSVAVGPDGSVLAADRVWD